METLISLKAVQLPLTNGKKAPRDSVVRVVAGGEILANRRRVAGIDKAPAGADDNIPGPRSALDGLTARWPLRVETRDAQAAQGQAVTL